MGRTLEAEEEIIEADLAVRSEAVAHGGEVDRAMVLVDLDGVASAERDVGTAFAGEMSEVALATEGAVRARVSG